MRSHEQIIRDAGGYKALADKLGLPRERVRFWQRRKSIPVGSWQDCASRRIASMTELHGAAVAANSNAQDRAA